MQPSPRARYWQLPDRRLEFGPQPVLMGIVNVTPDSFSDGGRYFSEDAAVAHALELVEQGADILDIGGESTRPYAEPVSEEEEMRRVLPVVRRLAASTSVPISIDTSKAAVARAALEAGATIVNDVTALRADPRMLDVIQQYRAAVCIMHMQGTPQTMQDNPHYEHVVSEVLAFLRERRDALLQAGVSVDRIAIDPGIGFGKTTAHNIELLKNIGRFHTLGCPVLVGHSRKGFIGKVIGDLQRDRVAGGIGVSLAMALRGVQILRVHDVEATRQALALFAACGALVDLPEDQPSEVDPMPGIR